jgi:hypothetical protein
MLSPRCASFARIALTVVLALTALAPVVVRHSTVAADGPVLDFVGQTGGVVGVLTVRGDRLYAVVGTSLAVIDVSDGTAPRLVARSRPLDALITDLAVAGDRAYLATRDEIVVMDLSAPEAPVVAGAYRADGQFQILAADEGHVYAVVSQANGASFQVLAPDGAGRLRRVGETPLSARIYENAQMVVSGGTVYFASVPLGVVAVDVSVPEAPALLGAYEDIKANGIAVGKDRVYVIGYREREIAQGEKRVTALLMALSTRAGTYLSPDVTVTLSTFGNPDLASYVATWDRFVYVGLRGGTELHILDGQLPDTLPELGLVELPWSFVSYIPPRNVAMDRGRLFVAVNGTCGLHCHAYGRFNGVLAVDGAPPGAVTGGWLVDQPADPWTVAAGEGAVAVGGDSQAIHFIETRSPTMPTFRGALVQEDDVFDLAAHGHRLLSSTNVQAKLIDFADPANPRLIEDVDVHGLSDLRAVALGEDIACAVARDREASTEVRLVVWVRQPDQHLARRGALVLGRWPSLIYSMVIHSGFGYLVHLREGLTVVDLRDPERPALVSRLDIAARAQTVTVAGRYAYITSWFDTPPEEMAKPSPRPYAGLTVVDVSDPTRPRIVGTYATFLDDYYARGQRWGVAVMGHYAIVALHDKWLRVLDVSDPTTPCLAQSFRVPSGAYDVAVSGDLVYLAAREGGLMVYRRHGADGGAGRMYLPFALRRRSGGGG